MNVSPIEENGKRFLISLSTKNGEAERFALGLGWVRSKILLYASGEVGTTVTTRSKTGLGKIADKLEGLTIPEDACDIEKSIRAKRIEGLGLTPETSQALGQMAIQLRSDIGPAVENPMESTVQPVDFHASLSILLEDYIQQF